MNSASLFSPEYNNFSSKPLPADLTEFLANPFHYRVTEDFLSHIVVDVRTASMFLFLSLNEILKTEGRIYTD